MTHFGLGSSIHFLVAEAISQEQKSCQFVLGMTVVAAAFSLFLPDSSINTARASSFLFGRR
jgi:hypothetical protein